MKTVSPKNTLLFVHIITHFKEMIRVARALKKDKNYNPIVIFITKYAGWEKDYKLCQLERIECLTYFNNNMGLQSLQRLKKLIFKVRSNTNPTIKNIFYFGYNVLIVLSIIVALVFKHRKFRSFFSKLSKFINLITVPLKKIKAYFMHSLVFIFKRFKPSFWSYILIKSYNLLWKSTPQVFSGLSKIAHNFYHSFPKILRDHQIQLIVFPEHNLFYFTQLKYRIICNPI